MIPLVYDQVNSWGKDDEFFTALLKSLTINTLADLGCGTGRLTTRFAELGYEITAIDPNAEAIAQARAKENADNIAWIVGDSSSLQPGSYDAVIMTANVAQVFLTDASWQQVLTDTYLALKPGGHFIFDTRNPLAKVWEEWEQDETPDLATDPVSGDSLHVWTDYEGFVDDIYTFYETVQNTKTNEVLVQQKMQLKFRTREVIQNSLIKAGFTEIRVHGDWEHTEATPESRSFIFQATKQLDI